MLLVLSGLLVSALLAPLLFRAAPRAAGWLLAIGPLAAAARFLERVHGLPLQEAVSETYAWVPSLGIQAAFVLDGVSLAFGLLICGIGALVLIYSGAYLRGRSDVGRFHSLILLFMGSMLGLVFSSNLIALFVFWELTSVCSYFLIGFDHERKEARAAAIQALLVTGLGGVALLGGIVMLGQAGGSYDLLQLAERRGEIVGSPLYPAILVLVLAGAFTKSAQFPFHFWLPNAMAAPAPASAYLHAATMVKAGVFLLIRMDPILGGTAAWGGTLTWIGATTMVVGAVHAIGQTYLKKTLAHTTVSALGILVLLIGTGTPAAMRGAMVFLVAHALYKGTLFLVAGSLDHETGGREWNRLGGLARRMPVTAFAGMVGALSMLPVPPLVGFIGKEMLYEAVVSRSSATLLLSVTAVAANGLLLVAAVRSGLRPFLGAARETPRPAHDPSPAMLLGPVVMAAAGLVFGLFPGLLEAAVLNRSLAAVAPGVEGPGLSLWHGWTLPLLMSALTLAGGGVCLMFPRALERAAGPFLTLAAGWGQRGYDRVILGISGIAARQTRLLQNGYLPHYIGVTLLVLVGMAGFVMIRSSGIRAPAGWGDASLVEGTVTLMIVAAALLTVWSKSRLSAIAAMGIVGYGVSFVFIMNGAPDLAMTLFVVETLMVILMVSVFHHLPRFTELSGRSARLRDAATSVLAGALMSALVFVALQSRDFPAISDFYGLHSLAKAHGRNVVNVILVDFRALDTLGEITVLAVAAIGTVALLKRPSRDGERA